MTAACTTTDSLSAPTQQGTKSEPAPPVPPTSSFLVESRGAVISGEVRRIAGSNPKTAVIVLGGSGAHSRNDVTAALPIFLNEKTAVAIFDRRGAGLSTGSLERPSTTNSTWQIPVFANDAAAIAAYLKETGFDRVGLVGSSMGGWIAVAAAAQSVEVDFAIAINGGASSVAQSDAFDTLTDQGLSIEEAIAAVRVADLPASYSPKSDLAKITQPILWILGGQDDSNPTALDVETIEHWRAQGKPYEIILVQGADHNFIDVETGEPNLSWIPTVTDFIHRD